MATDPVLITAIETGVMTLTLNRPKVNAFNFELIARLQEALRQAETDSQVRCVLLNGRGPVFSAGQELDDLARVEGSIREHLHRTYNTLILQIRRLEKPVLAAINGAVAGAALGVALSCDLRIAADDARFVVGFGGIGLALDSAVSLFLPLLAGLGRASELTFTNAPFTVQQALAWGLVNRVVPAGSLQEDSYAWAKILAAGPVGAIGLAKRAFNNAILANLEQVLEYEAQLQGLAAQGAEHKEGLAAFFEKRPARYYT